MIDFVKEKGVFVNQDLDSREDFLHFISEKALELGIASSVSAVYDALIAREEMGETGMTDGFAVPHAKCDAIKEAAVLVVKNSRPVEWPSFDDKPVDVAIALLVPGAETGTTHIKLLSKTAVLLMRDQFKRLLHGTDDRGAIADAINPGLDEE